MTEDTRSVDSQAARVTGALWTLLAAITGVTGEGERARLTATSLPTLLPCQLGGLAIVDEDEGTWQIALRNADRELESPLTDAVLAEVLPLAQKAFRSPRWLGFTAEGVDTVAFPPSIANFGVRYLAVIPLRTLESRFGVLLVGRGSNTPLSKIEQTTLLTLAAHLSTSIENVRLFGTLQHYAQNLERLVEERTDKLRRAEERRRALLEITNAVIANLDRGPLFAAVAHALTRALTVDYASVALRSPGSDVLQVYELDTTSSANELPPVKEIRARESYLEDVFAESRPVVRRDIEKERRGEAEEAFHEHGIKAYVAVPLIKQGAPFGSLTVGSHNADQYSDADASFLAEVGQQVAFAVDNMLAYEEIAALKSRLEQENLYLQEEIDTQHNFGEIIGKSRAIKNVLKAIETVAPTDAGVVITGETGTGKELVARAVHNLSPRRAKTLIKVNCASIPKELFESEFFGHARGAFTGALRDRPGRFELAHRGTLFLDEIGEIPLDMQSKLLRVLQEGEVERVGEERTRRVDVRIVAATNRDLKAEVEAGRFRQDLYYRLNVFPIELAPLRDRSEDIPLIAADFMRRTARRLNRPNPVLTQDGLQRLVNHRWPGNVRELQNTIERAMISSTGGPLWFDLNVGRDAEPSAPRDPDDEAAPKLTDVIPEEEWKRREQANVLAALRRTNWRISGRNGAAELLGINPATLTSRIKRMGLRRGD